MQRSKMTKIGEGLGVGFAATSLAMAGFLAVHGASADAASAQPNCGLSNFNPSAQPDRVKAFASDVAQLYSSMPNAQRSDTVVLPASGVWPTETRTVLANGMYTAKVEVNARVPKAGSACAILKRVVITVDRGNVRTVDAIEPDISRLPELNWQDEQTTTTAGQPDVAHTYDSAGAGVAAFNDQFDKATSDFGAAVISDTNISATILVKAMVGN